MFSLRMREDVSIWNSTTETAMAISIGTRVKKETLATSALRIRIGFFINYPGVELDPMQYIMKNFSNKPDSGNRMLLVIFFRKRVEFACGSDYFLTVRSIQSQRRRNHDEDD